MTPKLIHYKGQKLTLDVIAKIERIPLRILEKYYSNLGDIRLAIEKINEKYIEYNGERLTLNAIAQKEGITHGRLTRAFLKTKNIYKAVSVCKSTKKISSVEIEIIEYNGEEITIEEIAQREGLDVGELNRYYKRTGNIYEAVQQYKAVLKRKVKKIDYNGESLAISAIAKREGIDIKMLTAYYKESKDIYIAVKRCKKQKERRKEKNEERAQEKQKGKMEYKGEKLSPKEIAQRENIDTRHLKNCLKETEDIYKAVFMAKYVKRKNEVVDFNGTAVNLYDVSVLIGVRYRDFINLLNTGMSIDEIKEKYVSQYPGEKIKLRSGRTLLELCIEENLNISYMYRAIHTYGKSIKIAKQEYKKGTIPLEWILDKYDNILNKLNLNGLQRTLIINDLQNGQLSLEDALEKYILRKNANKYGLSFEWSEALYSLIKMREILGNEYQGKIRLNENETAFINECETELSKMRRELQEGTEGPKKQIDDGIQDL